MAVEIRSARHLVMKDGRNSIGQAANFGTTRKAQVTQSIRHRKSEPGALRTISSFTLTEVRATATQSIAAKVSARTRLRFVARKPSTSLSSGASRLAHNFVIRPYPRACGDSLALFQQSHITSRNSSSKRGLSIRLSRVPITTNPVPAAKKMPAPVFPRQVCCPAFHSPSSTKTPKADTPNQP